MDAVYKNLVAVGFSLTMNVAPPVNFDPGMVANPVSMPAT
jgi:hypothetical protein